RVIAAAELRGDAPLGSEGPSQGCRRAQREGLTREVEMPAELGRQLARERGEIARAQPALEAGEQQAELRRRLARIRERRGRESFLARENRYVRPLRFRELREGHERAPAGRVGAGDRGGRQRE